MNSDFYLPAYDMQTALYWVFLPIAAVVVYLYARIVGTINRIADRYSWMLAAGIALSFGGGFLDKINWGIVRADQPAAPSIGFMPIFLGYMGMLVMCIAGLLHIHAQAHLAGYKWATLPRIFAAAAIWYGVVLLVFGFTPVGLR